jgi:hypothetical protein
MPALDSPSLLESLWRQQLFCYHENPLPQLFKEKLALRLSCCCASPYCIITHACVLHQLGIGASEIRKLLEIPVFPSGGIEHVRELLANVPHPIQAWPEEDSDFEKPGLQYGGVPGLAGFGAQPNEGPGMCNASAFAISKPGIFGYGRTGNFARPQQSASYLALVSKPRLRLYSESQDGTAARFQRRCSGGRKVPRAV